MAASFAYRSATLTAPASARVCPAKSRAPAATRAWRRSGQGAFHGTAGQGEASASSPTLRPEMIHTEAGPTTTSAGDDRRAHRDPSAVGGVQIPRGGRSPQQRNTCLYSATGGKSERRRDRRTVRGAQFRALAVVEGLATTAVNTWAVSSPCSARPVSTSRRA